MTHTENTEPTYAVGQWLYFTPSEARAPHGAIVPEGAVIVTDVVDHGTANVHGAPRFSYVVRAIGGTWTQGTDDRELSELPDAATLPEPRTVESPDGREYAILRYDSRRDAAASAVEYVKNGASVETPPVFPWTVRVYVALPTDHGRYGVEPGAPRAVADPSRCPGCGLGFAGPRGVAAHRSKAMTTGACRLPGSPTVAIPAKIEPMPMTTTERAKVANAALTTAQRQTAGRARAAQLHSPVSLARRLGGKWADLTDAERKDVRRELRAAGVIS